MTPVDQAMADISAGRRVCPLPVHWNELWKMLPNRKQVDAGWIPPLPLILAAWHETTNGSKRERLRDHLQWAYEHGVFDAVTAFLSGLKPVDWHMED